LLAVVEHEMDEVLGLMSNLDSSTTGPIFPTRQKKSWVKSGSGSLASE